MLSVMKLLGRPPKAVGPLVNVIGAMSDTRLHAALAEIGEPASWPAVKRDRHRKLKQGRSLILRDYNHRDTEMRERFPALEAIVQQVLTLGYGSVPGKIVVACLPPGKQIKPHRDVGGYYKFHNRIHVPLRTTAGATMHSAGVDFHMERGKVYLFQNLEVHSATNASEDNRLHLILDVLDHRYSAWIYRKFYLLLASNFLFLGTLYRLCASLLPAERGMPARGRAE
ncbi:aspartyl/asparaginyl beta-hydroxylase domain-containing protein [Burkholderia multivorans]|uniref:aspartyl/asparaginyl beta-hydroxylase domain-containing protein n=1 Tax=Burkholderia multivorans TaxID=87883 RepID=UPI0021C09F44|nr:aspartyl/asparaginyl beta-hydroxylase domain-containing protein [Burkholderia multivorans]